jgi:predicted secreted protein
MNYAIHLVVLFSAYAMLWFVCFLCLLPVGLGEIDPETGAPLKPMLGRKSLIASVVAAFLWLGFYIAVGSGWLTL